jgi:hypothetical protein
MPHHRKSPRDIRSADDTPLQETTPHVGSHGAIRKALPRAACGMATRPPSRLVSTSPSSLLLVVP